MGNDCTRTLSFSSLVEISTSFAQCFAGLDPADFFLRNFDVTLGYTLRLEGKIFANVIFHTTKSDFPFSTVLTINPVNGDTDIQATDKPDNANIGSFSTSTASTFNFVFRSFTTNQDPIIFSLTYPFQGNEVTIRGSRERTLGVIPPTPSSEILPNIRAEITPTPDGKQICQLDFTVKKGNEHALSTNHYRQYCLDFASVICCGKACTLLDKLNCLVQKKNVDQALFVRYMILRYILSALLGVKPFHEFNIQLLRRRYYACFLQALDKTEYRVFVPTFQATPDYWQFFLA